MASQATTMLRVFPLSAPVLFPGALRPLHVFEPRYRQLAAAALAGDRRIGMTTVREEHAAEMAGDPPLHEVGCAGVIVNAQKLPDGRYDIILRGTHRFRIVSEPPRPSDQLFRSVEALPLDELAASGEALRPLRETLTRLLLGLVPPEQRAALESSGGLLELPDDALFVNHLCQLLDLPPSEAQALLDAPGCQARAQRLVEVLGFRLAELRTDPHSRPRTVH